MAESDKIEPGFLNINDWAKAWSVRRSSAERFIVIAMKKGLMEKKTFRIATKGRYCKVGYFRATK